MRSTPESGRRTRRAGPYLLLAAAVLAVAAGAAGCRSTNASASSTAPPATRHVIQNAGSDTMVNVAQAWAEEYASVDPLVSVEVSGGGSGTGIAALINNTVDLANASRKMEKDEIQKATAAAGHAPQEYVTGYDALAIYVHRDNPLTAISLDELREIYGENGAIERWSQLGIENGGCRSDRIILVSRQSNSGTFYYFREALFGRTRDMRLGSLDLHGSKDVVELVARTPCAIGFSGLGYATDEVRALAISEKKGGAAYVPNIENTISRNYPIARPLYVYTHGIPSEPVRRYLEWIFSDEGQKIVEETGYVPLPPELRKQKVSVQ